MSLADPTQQFTLTGYDQFGAPIALTGSTTWSVASGGGSINSTGMYTAAPTSGTVVVQAVIQAANGQFSGSATIQQGIFSSDADIGLPSQAGSGSYSAGSGIYTVAGGGSDIWSTADQFNLPLAALQRRRDDHCPRQACKTPATGPRPA